MSKVICLEGPDGSGKSTLANYFIEKYKTAYIHVSNYKDKTQTISQHPLMYKFSNEWKYNQLSDIVFDRSIISLLIYGHIFDNDEDKQEVNHYMDINYKSILGNIDKLIFCLPPKDRYLDRFEQLKNERFELFDNMNDIYDAYYCLYHGISNDKIKNDWYQNIIKVGGLKMYDNVYLYDYTSNGNDLYSFVKNIRE